MRKVGCIILLSFFYSFALFECSFWVLLKNVCMCVCVYVSRSVASDSLLSYGL